MLQHDDEHNGPDRQRRLGNLRQMLQLDPENATLRRRYVDVAMSLGRSDLAAQEIESCLQRHPGDAQMLFQLASLLIANGDHTAALEKLARLREAGVQDPAIDFNAGLCHYCLGEYELARALLEACRQSGMRSAGLLRLLVSSCHHLGRLDEAVRIAGENEAIAANDAALAGVYALLYLDSNDAARAARWAQAALQLDPKSLDGRVTQATLLTARMQTGAARQMLEDVLEDSPSTGRAWIGLGALDLLDRNIEAAKQRLARGLELMPGHVGSWHVLAWAHLMSGALQAAERNFNRALELDRNFAETHGGLASVYALRGDRAPAQRLIETALKLDRDCLSARFARAVLQAPEGRPDQMFEAVQDAVSIVSAPDGSALSRLLTRVAKRPPQPS